MMILTLTVVAWVAWVGYLPCSTSFVSQAHCNAARIKFLGHKDCRKHSGCCGSANSDSNNVEEEEEFDLDSVSDEEALLACRAYLQRKNRLGLWTEAQRRQRLREQVSPDSFSSSSVGYFWEDPEELVYWKTKAVDILQKKDNESDVPSLMDIDSQETLDSFKESLKLELAQEEIDYEENDSLTGDDFTGFPLFPPDESRRRSQAQKQKWKNEEWKRMWYEKRWGQRQSCISEELKKQKKLDSRIQALPAEILASPELANMSSEEIAEAIRTYVVANRKRSESHKRRARKQKEELAKSMTVDTSQEKTPRDALFSMSQDAMREAQRRRSERAAKAYQTRVENERQRAKTHKPKRKVPTRVPKAMTPRDALIRMQADLDSDRMPSIEDVKLVMAPQKLSRRKELFKRILTEQLDVRGKVVPKDLSKPDSDLLFVSKCSVEKLGEFVLYKMQEKEGE